MDGGDPAPLTPMSSSSDRPQQNLPLLDSSNIKEVVKGRIRRKSQKRRTLSSRYRLGASKRRRLGITNGSKSRWKEGLSDYKDSLNKLPVASVDANHTTLCPNADDISTGSCRETSPRKVNGTDSGTVADGWVMVDVEIRTSIEHGATQQSNAEILESPSSLHALRDLKSGQQSAVGSKQDTATEGRVLRPRRPSSREAKQLTASSKDSAQIVGQRITVYWPLDTAWYSGFIQAYDPSNKQHQVIYDDGDVEWLLLSKERFRLGASYLPGSTREPSMMAQGAALGSAIEQSQELSARQSAESAELRGKVEDGSNIGDDVLLSAVVPRHRLEGVLRKGSGNGSAKSGNLAHQIDVVERVKEIDFPNEKKSVPRRSAKAAVLENGGEQAARSIEDTGQKHQERGLVPAERVQESRVYVRRQKYTAKETGAVATENLTTVSKFDKASFTSVPMPNQASSVKEQDQVRRRKKASRPVVSEEAQPSLPGPGVSDLGDELVSKSESCNKGTEAHLQRRLPRKRNRQSLKRVVRRSLGTREGHALRSDSRTATDTGFVDTLGERRKARKHLSADSIRSNSLTGTVGENATVVERHQESSHSALEGLQSHPDSCLAQTAVTADALAPHVSKSTNLSERKNSLGGSEVGASHELCDKAHDQIERRDISVISESNIDTANGVCEKYWSHLSTPISGSLDSHLPAEVITISKAVPMAQGDVEINGNGLDAQGQGSVTQVTDWIADFSCTDKNVDAEDARTDDSLVMISGGQLHQQHLAKVSCATAGQHLINRGSLGTINASLSAFKEAGEQTMGSYCKVVKDCHFFNGTCEHTCLALHMADPLDEERVDDKTGSQTLPDTKLLNFPSAVISIPVLSVMGDKSITNQRESSGTLCNSAPECNLNLHTAVAAFHCSIYLVCLCDPVDQFAQQLSNILEVVRFYESDCSGKCFHLNASLGDLVGLLQLLFSIIKALPLSVWTHQRFSRHWQGRILYSLWAIVSGSQQWSADVPSVLSAKTKSLLMQHLKTLARKGNSVRQLTFRQFLNILVCYFIKPYIVATICERGALLTVIIQHFLLPEMGNCLWKKGIPCVRQGLMSVTLRSDAGADSAFFSYLCQFPMCGDCCSEDGLFEKQMDKWTASAAALGYTDHPVPVPSVKIWNNKALQVTTAHIDTVKTAPLGSNKIFYLDSPCNAYTCLRGSFLGCYTGEPAVGSLDDRAGSQRCFRKISDVISALILTSLLQKRLLAGSSSLSSAFGEEEGWRHKEITSSLLASDRGLESHKEVGQQLSTIVEEHADGKEAGTESEGWAPMKRAKLEADLFVPHDISGTPYNAAVKHEGLGESFDWLITKGSADSMKDARLSPFCNEIYPAVGSPSTSSFESNIRWVNTGHFTLGYSQDLIGSSLVCENGKETWVDSKMSSYYSGPLVGKKRKRKTNRSDSRSWRDPKKGSKRGRPRHSDQEKGDEEVPSHCFANLLIIKGDRGWREVSVRVELQSDGSACFIAVQSADGKIYKQKVQESILTSKTNRHTHAVMWKGGGAWSLEFCDRIQWNIFKRLYEECGHRNARAASVKQIPIPGVRLIDDRDVGNLESAPSSSPCLVRQAEGEVEAALKNNRILYDMESEDEAWLTNLNMGCLSSLSTIPKLPVTDEVFERIMDKLEKIAYMRDGKMASVDEAVEFCQDLESADVVQYIHAYWSKKRLIKGTALIRHFQPPLWEQYQKQIQDWQIKFNELQLSQSNATKEQLLKQCPRPPMFAFCLPSRGLDTNNVNRKMQKQRPQKKLNSVFRSSKASSLDTSEESHRVSVSRSQRMHGHHQLASSSVDPDWQPSPRPRQSVSSKYKHILRDRNHEQGPSGFLHGTTGLDSHTKAEEAHVKASAARRVAAMKATKSHIQFLKFDSAYHRAVAAVIEFESIHSTELMLADQDGEACSSSAPMEQLSCLKDKVEVLSGQFSSLLDRRHDTSRDCGEPSYSVGGDLIWDVSKQEFQESCAKQGLIGEADALLPTSARGHSDSWMGTTLLQRAE